VSNVTLVEGKIEKKDKRPSTAHLKAVPQVRAERDRIRTATADFLNNVDRAKPLSRAGLQEMAQSVLRSLEQSEQFLGFTMVCLANEFWRDQVSAIDFKRRLLLLPHCLKHAEGCPADYDEFGLDCRKCGACSVADFKIQAEELGYKVLVSEGTPIVLKIIVSGHVDAIVGVACLNVLEKALDKILLAGIPCVAAPLLSSNCRSTSVDDDWVSELIDLRTQPPAATTRSYVHLMRTAHQICEEPELSRLAPRSRTKSPLAPLAGRGVGGEGLAHPGTNGSTPQPLSPQARRGATDPLSEQETIAYDWLGQGGKRSRPLITLAVYDALKGGKGTLGAEGLDLPDAVRRTALAIETFHKASLVHDDIEDDDTFRYGRETLHRRHGVSTAINVGDYLIGLGYRLVSRERAALGAECAADILDRLADAHLKLSEGQGAELLWRDAADKSITPLDALKIYALKTAPAFEAALYAGLRLAGPTTAYDKMVVEFSRHLGIAFQILNDFKDWEGDSDNKMVAGQDVLAARPTLLLALALEGLTGAKRTELLHALESKAVSLERVRRLFEEAQVFAKADKLIEKYRARAEAIADEVEPTELRELLYYLVDSVLDRHVSPSEPPMQLVQLSV
jgi:geranylgeranyl diphosphate synthase type II